MCDHERNCPIYMKDGRGILINVGQACKQCRTFFARAHFENILSGKQ